VRSERQEEIMLLLQEHGHLTVSELARHFAVSDMTIRRDLKVLTTLGLIQREHGKALHPAHSVSEEVFWQRLGEADREKVLIGRLAASMVADGDSIILDAGTTTLALARALTQKCVVFTNSLPIAGTLSYRPEMTVILTGGEVRGATNALVGPMTRESFIGFNADKLFLAATGVSVERGLSTASMLESEVKQTMLKAAKEVFLVADSKKLGKVFCHTFANWDKIDFLITDSMIKEPTRKELESIGVQVLIAQHET